MERISDYIARGENYEYEQDPAELLQQQTAEKVTKACEIAENITHVDFRRAAVKKLAGDVAGQQDMTNPSVSTGMTIDEDLLKRGSEEDITHVMVHENTHRTAAEKSNGERVQSLEWEEAITELSTSKQLNDQPIAYHEYIRQFRNDIQRVTASENELIQAYRNGDIETINKAIWESEQEKAA